MPGRRTKTGNINIFIPHTLYIMISTVLHGIATPQAGGIWQCFIIPCWNILCTAATDCRIIIPYTIYRERWTLCRHDIFMFCATIYIHAVWLHLLDTQIYIPFILIYRTVQNVLSTLLFKPTSISKTSSTVHKFWRTKRKSVIYTNDTVWYIWPYDRAHNKWKNPYLPEFSDSFTSHHLL